MPSQSRPFADTKVQTTLDALARDIEDHPENLLPIDGDLVSRVRALVAGIEVNLDQPLPSEPDGTGTH